MPLVPLPHSLDIPSFLLRRTITIDALSLPFGFIHPHDLHEASFAQRTCVLPIRPFLDARKAKRVFANVNGSKFFEGWFFEAYAACGRGLLLFLCFFGGRRFSFLKLDGRLLRIQIIFHLHNWTLLRVISMPLTGGSLPISTRFAIHVIGHVNRTIRPSHAVSCKSCGDAFHSSNCGLAANSMSLGLCNGGCCAGFQVADGRRSRRSHRSRDSSRVGV
mmetsp:Transcript_18737/g.39329  ORF Transcript_18737/g.39329 Transcript_18737/m.39329 type:complete len:218 (+) Transcript_18737:342-995(+)